MRLSPFILTFTLCIITITLCQGNEESSCSDGTKIATVRSACSMDMHCKFLYRSSDLAEFTNDYNYLTRGDFHTLYWSGIETSSVDNFTISCTSTVSTSDVRNLVNTMVRYKSLMAAGAGTCTHANAWPQYDPSEGQYECACDPTHDCEMDVTCSSFESTTAYVLIGLGVATPVLFFIVSLISATRSLSAANKVRRDR